MKLTERTCTAAAGALVMKKLTLIGSEKEKLLKLRTKEAVVLAGLSLPRHRVRQRCPSRKILVLFANLNNSLLTAQLTKATTGKSSKRRMVLTDAMAAG